MLNGGTSKLCGRGLLAANDPTYQHGEQDLEFEGVKKGKDLLIRLDQKACLQ